MSVQNYIDRALNCLEEAFAPPVYCGDRPQAKLTKDGAALLDRAHSILKYGQASKGADAISAFCLGIVHRYGSPANQGLFLSQMRQANSHDADWLEPAIALRDGNEYTDPFCYPRWEDLKTGRARFAPSIMQSPIPKTGKIDLVRYGLLLIPAVVVKSPKDSFRSPLSTKTRADVLVDIDAVIPAMPAVMHVMPVIFDDHNDPFWQNHYLNLFPVESEIEEGISIHLPPDYQPWLGRDTARRFCQEPYQCVLYVLDEDNRLMMARLIRFGESKIQRFREMDQVLKILGDKKINYMLWKHSMEIHEKTISKEIKNPDGKTIIIPKRPKAKLSDVVVFPVVAKKGKLLAKTAGERKISGLRRPANDVFISYSHTDVKLAKKVEKWIKTIWNSLRIFRTHPKSDELFHEDPLYFTAERIRSRCLVFLATPASINRAWVKAELGGAREIPVITLLAGGTRLDDLGILFEDLYCKVDPERVADTATQAGWENFAKLLAETLDLELSSPIPKGPDLSSKKLFKGQPQDGKEGFFTDLLQMLKLKRQTMSQAEAMLETLEQAYADRAEKDGVIIRWDMLFPQTPRMRLATLLSTFDNEMEIRKILGLFPALVDRKLIAELGPVAEHAGNYDDDLAKQFCKLFVIVREVVAAKKG